MRNKIILIIVVVLALILGRWLISNFDKAKTAKQRALGAIPAVTVTEVGSRYVTRQFQANARVVSKYRVDVLARISGYLTKSYFKEGDYVKAGQVLFEIEPNNISMQQVRQRQILIMQNQCLNITINSLHGIKNL